MNDLNDYRLMDQLDHACSNIGSLLFRAQSKRFIATINVSMVGKKNKLPQFCTQFALDLHVFLFKKSSFYKHNI